VGAERCGAIRLPRDDKHARRLREHAEASPAEWMQWLTAAEAAARVGAPVCRRRGVDRRGLECAPGLVAALLAASGAELRTGTGRRPRPAGSGGDPAAPPVWRVTLADGSASEWGLVVVANAFGVAGHTAFPLRPVRGRLSWAEGRGNEGAAGDRLPRGYVMPATQGRHMVGATFQRDDADLAPRDEDDRTNQWRLARLLPAWGDRPLQPARVSVRAATPDRLPLVGMLAPGLYASLGHGSRGLTCAPLCGELVASMACGEPLPLPRDLVRRLDPFRFGPVEP
jgi:tRNA 5-methylaminomethyl-2-thiouridine biosynthesis bifunctional protein